LKRGNNSFLVQVHVKIYKASMKVSKDMKSRKLAKVVEITRWI
jgi:hypothetical protein